MKERRTPSPSPLVGEGRSRALARERGEGGSQRNPSPGRSRPPSPTRGEGTEQVSRPATPTKTSYARVLRKQMTDAELKLWFALRDLRFANFKFRRQVPMGRYIADFICFERRVVIEVDGGQHGESQSDTMRDHWFASEGFVTLRFWNNDVLQNFDGVLTAVLDTLHQRNPSPGRSLRSRPPSPTRGEGTEQAPRAVLMNKVGRGQAAQAEPPNVGGNEPVARTVAGDQGGSEQATRVAPHQGGHP